MKESSSAMYLLVYLDDVIFRYRSSLKKVNEHTIIDTSKSCLSAQYQFARAATLS